LKRYLSILGTCSGEPIELERRGRWDRERQWRHVYAARLHATTGRWRWREYDWHVFSYQHARALSGAKAVPEYLRHAAPVLIIIPEESSSPDLPAIRLSGARLPRFEGAGLDVLVWPEDLTWTMAFTHEEGCFGPYFSRREWAVPDADAECTASPDR
jgi:hypothetical protein